MRRIGAGYIFFFSLSFFSQQPNKNVIALYNEQRDLVKKYSVFDSAKMFYHGSKAIGIIKKNDLSYLEAEIRLCYANYFFFQADYKAASVYYSEAEKIASEQRNDTLKNIIRVKFAFIEHELGNWSASRKIYEEVIDNATAVNDTSALIEAFNGLASLKEHQNQNDEALKDYNDALRLAEKSGKKHQFAYLLNNRALLNMKLNFNGPAKRDLLRALDLSQDVRLTGNVINNLGLIFMQEQKTDSALTYFNQFSALAKKSGMPEGLVVALINIAQIRSQKGGYEEAFSSCDSALAIAEKHGLIFYIPKIYNALSDLSAKKKQYRRSIEFAQKSIEASRKINSLEDLGAAYNLAAQAYAELRDYQNAYLNHQNFKLYNDSLNNQAQQKRFSELQVQYEVEQKEKIIQEEKSQLEIMQKEKEIDSSRKQMWMILLAAAGLLVSGGIYIRFVRNMRRQQEKFSQKLIESIEEERSRISKELHDDIGTSLSIVKNKIFINTDKGDRQMLGELTADISSVIEQTRTISHQLYPSYLYKLGINEAILHFLGRIQKDTSLAVRHSIAQDLDPMLSPVNKMHLFRIIQELVNNTLKHAGASKIMLEIQTEGNSRIHMEYQDNGRGLQDSGNAGMGMISMRERVKILNGKMKIEADIDKGEKGFKISFIFNVGD